jgi:hypothetical protein
VGIQPFKKISYNTMALTNISKEHLDNLLVDLNRGDISTDKLIKNIQKNSNAYSKLQVLFKQLAIIKQEINETINETIQTSQLELIECKFKKIPGNHYYLYKRNKDGLLFFSMLKPKEWNYTTNNEFLGEYLYDYGLNLQKIN